MKEGKVKREATLFEALIPILVLIGVLVPAIMIYEESPHIPIVIAAIAAAIVATASMVNAYAATYDLGLISVSGPGYQTGYSKSVGAGTFSDTYNFSLSEPLRIDSLISGWAGILEISGSMTGSTFSIGAGDTVDHRVQFGVGSGLFTSYSLTVTGIGAPATFGSNAWGTWPILPGGGTYGVSFYGTPVTAVPEPESFAMLLAGLGVIGTLVRRRKTKGISVA